MLGDPGEHMGANLFAFVKCKNEIGPTFPRQRSVRAGLPF